MIGDWLGDDVARALGDRAGDLGLAADAVLRGGAAALSHYGDTALDVRSKSEGDPVTEADHAANDEIIRILSAGRPLDPILSEESVPPVLGRRPPRLWVVDPLDGTKEFIAGNGEFSIMVGLAEHGEAVLGTVYQPVPDRLFLGGPGIGAWVVADAQRTAVVTTLDLSPRTPDRLRFARSRSHPDERLQRLADSLGDVEMVVSGSVGIKCALIASGEADIYVHPVPFLKEWDTCGPEAVLRGAGGRVTDCLGRSLDYGKENPHQLAGIFAARPDVWERSRPLVEAIADFV